MKITVTKADLEAATKRVAPSLSNSGEGVESHALFRKTGDLVEILASSGRLCSSEILPCTWEGPDGLFTIEGSRLSKWLRAVDNAPLVLEYKNKKVHATSPRGEVVFQSRDTSSFPFWDKEVAKAKPTAKVKASVLMGILDYVKHFVWDQDTKAPQFCVTEVLNGKFWASDQSSLVLVEIDGFEECTLRVFLDDIPSCLKYLSFLKDENVEILETEKCVYFRRPDGGIFGFTRFSKAFPELKNFGSDVTGQFWWSYEKGEVLKAISILEAAASKKDVRLQVVPFPKEDRFEVRMRAASGDMLPISIPMTDYGSVDNPQFPLPSEGFTINHLFVRTALASHTEDIIRMGVCARSQGRGWVKFDETRNGAYYLTVLTWMAV